MSMTRDQFQHPSEAEVSEVYSGTVIDRARHPRNLGALEGANGFARITGSCGDTMEIWLKVRDGVINEATFVTDGCGTSIASGSMVTELAQGKTVGEALRIEQCDVLDALGGLPGYSRHCALLAANTLKEAIKDYLTFKNEPWKRAYRKD
jgi:nitrogen fixation NifU-like protein